MRHLLFSTIWAVGLLLVGSFLVAGLWVTAMELRVRYQLMRWRWRQQQVGRR